MTLFNPGEPVFDQATGEPVINPVTGDLVEVVENGVYTNAQTLQTHDADDVANAVYFAVNTFSGEVPRRQDLGVNYFTEVFGVVGLDVAIGQVAKAARRTPGVQSVTGVRAIQVDPVNRALYLDYRLVKKSGPVVTNSLQVGG